jgi:tRNA-intron endonuclease
LKALKHRYPNTLCKVDSTMTSAQAEKEFIERKKAEAILARKEIVVSTKSDVDTLSSRGFGTVENEKLKLAFYEALFLLDRGLIEVKWKKQKKTLGFQEVLQLFRSKEENAWAKYLIYRDLRSRGYVVRNGFGLGMDFRLYERGEYGKDAAEYVVYGIQEGKPVPMKELANALKFALSAKKKLVLAVLNRRGEVVYYSLSKLTMR